MFMFLMCLVNDDDNNDDGEGAEEVPVRRKRDRVSIASDTFIEILFGGKEIMDVGL